MGVTQDQVVSNASASRKMVSKCLILAPREPGFEQVTALLREALTLAGVDAVTLNSQVEYGGVVSDVALQIPRAIDNADAVIVDITGANPNVMYELGFAHALKKPVLPILKRGEQEIPADLQGYLYFPYDPFEKGALFDAVIQWLGRALAKRFA